MIAPPPPVRFPRSTRHHTVPQFYLRRFADQDERLQILNKDTASIYGPTHIRNVAVESNFHTINTEDGPSDEFELIVAQLEMIYAAGVAGLDKRFPPGDESRAYVSMFVTFQFVRSSTWRNITLTNQGEMMKWMSQMMARDALNNDAARAWYEANVGEGKTDEELDELLNWQADGDYEIVVDGQEHIREMLNHLQDGRLANLILNRSWSLIYTRHPDEFITSEHPVALWSSHNGPLGLGSAEEVTLPLDRNRLLLMTKNPADQGKRRLATPGQVRHLNARTRGAARRFAFAHPLTRREVLRGE